MSRTALSLFILMLNFSYSSLATAANEAAAKRMVILGDSLTEGLGVSREEAYPAKLEKKIRAAMLEKKWEVVNAGVSGSTSASAVSRLNWILKRKPDLLLLELGANDGLRGLPVSDLEKNLAAAIELAQKSGVPVILFGMQVPPNYGKDYSRDFAAVFPRLAARFKVPLVPFFLEAVAGKPELNQADGIHPTAKGHALVADTVFRAIQKQL